MGDDVTYSGTVSAAMEATLMGVPAFALSLEAASFHMDDFRIAASFAADLAQLVLDRGLPPDTFLNVNVPAGTPKGVRLTRQGRRRYGDVVVEKIDPRGRKYYWLGAGDLDFQDLQGTDFHAVRRGFISVTPLHLDLTNTHSFQKLAGWGLEDRSPSSFLEQ